MSSESQQKWEQCLGYIRAALKNDTRFETWFANTRALGLSGNKLTIELPSHYCYELYEDQLFGLISAALLKTFGRGIQLEYVVPVVAGEEGGSMKLTRDVSPQERSKTRIQGKKLIEPQAPALSVNGGRNPMSPTMPSADEKKDNNTFKPFLNPALSFENYCVSDINRLPASIARNIAEHPRNSNFNPFFLYGNVGVGKTHLMQAIGLQVMRHFPDAKVLFIPMKEFQRLYACAAIQKAVPNFINWFMGMDVLLFDDLQELENKTGTLNDALFPIFNHLHQNGKQLIFTCDRPPHELKGIADRLIDRFKWGLTEQLPKPDYKLRKEILSFKAAKNGIELSPEVIETIASAPINSVREIEGIVMGILTRAIKMGSPIDVALAHEVMRNSVAVPTRQSVNFDMIVEATSEFYNLNPDVIFSKSKVRDVSDARMVIMYLTHKVVGLSSVAIGRKLRRKHSTVLHGIRAITERISVTPEVRDAVAEIERRLQDK